MSSGVRKIGLMASLALLLSSAQSGRAYVSGGHEYDATCNDSGYVLTSKYPVSRIIGHGAGSRAVSETESLFLGKSCDAYHKLYGYGEWCWANGGFIARFSEIEFGFARQELFCPQGDTSFSTNCRC